MPVGVWSEFAPGSCPSVVRRVAHWVEHYRVGLAVISGGRFRAGCFGGAWSGMKHTVGCLKQHHRTLFVGFGCFFLALVPEMLLVVCWWCGWGWCVLFENCTVDASIFNCCVECKCVRAHGGCLGTKSR